MPPMSNNPNHIGAPTMTEQLDLLKPVNKIIDYTTSSAIDLITMEKNGDLEAGKELSARRLKEIEERESRRDGVY